MKNPRNFAVFKCDNQARLSDQEMEYEVVVRQTVRYWNDWCYIFYKNNVALTVGAEFEDCASFEVTIAERERNANSVHHRWLQNGAEL